MQKSWDGGELAGWAEFCGAAALFVSLACFPAEASDTAGIEEVFVVGAAPEDVGTIAPTDVSASHVWTVTDLLKEEIPGIVLTDTESNPFQMDLYYHGYDASPVLGTAEGLAVYQGSTRINQAFGDTIMWDLVPSFAVDQIEVVPGSDPLFGRNALGGAIVLNMKNGFNTAPAMQTDVAVGSFGRAHLVVQAAQQFGDDQSIYLGATAIDDSGWRRSSQSLLYQAYGDFAWRSQRADAAISLTLATDSLNENGAIPVQDSAVAAFAIPDTARDRDAFLQARGRLQFGDGYTLRTSAYLRATRIATANGESSGFAPCTARPAILCDDDGDPLHTLDDTLIASSLGGNGTDGIESIATTALGFSFEIDRSVGLMGRNNDFALGDTLDYATTDFGSATQLGNLLYQQGGTTTVPLDVFLGGPEWNVRLRTQNIGEGLYAQDSVALTPALTVVVSARLGFDSIDLSDRMGVALDGRHDYPALNPGIEFAWRIAQDLSTYVEFEQSNRTPTSAELACADAARPCLFPLSFISDPSLKQVVARTLELGAKGATAAGGLSLSWSGDAYVTRNENDIIFESSGPFPGSGFFANAGTTQRFGAEIGADAGWGQFDLRAGYAFVDVTFLSTFAESSPDNPGANADGTIFVRPGDRLPNVPRSTAKFELGYSPLPDVRFAIGATMESAQYLRGDEANLQPPMPGYAVWNAEADWHVSGDLLLYLQADNLFDRRYATFGLYGDPTGNGAFSQFTNPRFIVPAQPSGLWVGLRALL